MFRSLIHSLSLGCLFFCTFIAAAYAQPAEISASAPSGDIQVGEIDAWLSEINTIEEAAQSGLLQPSEASSYRSRLNEIRNKAQSVGDTIRDEIRRVDTLLDALSVPKDEAKSEAKNEAENKTENKAPVASPIQKAVDATTPEKTNPTAKDSTDKDDTTAVQDSEVSQQQQKYETQKSFLEDQLSKIELILALTKQLDEEFLAKQARAFIDAVFDRLPHPLAPETWASGRAQLTDSLGDTSRFINLWWSEHLLSNSGLGPSFRLGPTAALILLTALSCIWIYQRHIPTRTSQPSSRIKQAKSATVIILTNGLLPILALIASLQILTLDVSESDINATAFIRALVYALCFFVGAASLIRVAVSPLRPGWAYLSIAEQRNWPVYFFAIGLAALAALDLSIELFFAVADVPEASLRSLYFFLTNVASGILLILLLRSRNWDMQNKSHRALDPSSSEKRFTAITLPVASTFRHLVSIAAAMSIATLFISYVPLGDYIIGNTTTSLLFVLAGILAHLLFEDVISALTNTAERDDTESGEGETKAVIVWLQLLADTVILVVVAALVAMEWGLPKADLTRLFTAFVQGFEIGDTRISLVDIGLGIGIFSAILIATRLTQKALEAKVFRASALDSGVQDSIQTVVGYAGLITAALFGVGAVGFDLSSLALIAGALSVGIGFGLQTTVSNFVAGLILLLERPVKVGDLIVVDDELGTINKINARATEIITLDKASVIVPNESLVASKIRNLTHKDRLGRLNIPVGVAYGSDTDKVKQCLLEAAEEHPDVSKDPEPQVLFTDFGSSSLDMELRAYTADITDGIRIRSDLRFAIDAKFRERNIEIPFPQRVIHTANDSEKTENSSTTPEEDAEPTEDSNSQNGGQSKDD